MAQLPLDKVFLIAAWAEALVYGFFLCLYCATLYFTFESKRRHDVHGSVMVVISSVMFFIATWHLVMNLYRLLRGYVDHALTPGGPVAYIGNLPLWDHILKDTLYATQEILGSAAAIYRCWVIWKSVNKGWVVIILPLMLMVVQIVSGYTVCGLYTSIDATKTVFDAKLNRWILTFYSVAVVQNIITTGLMAYRIWKSHRQSAEYTTGKGNLMPIFRILVESAALQLVVEIILLALYSSNINAQYILLECVAPIVGITFNIITIRLRLHTINGQTTSGSSVAGSRAQVHTIGSVPMRRIRVNIEHDVEEGYRDDLALEGRVVKE